MEIRENLRFKVCIVVVVKLLIVRCHKLNISPFRFVGTNTYLISRPIRSDESAKDPIDCILIDTGEGKEDYINVLKDVLIGQDSRVGPSKRVITDIVLTHWHHDHIGGLPSVLKLLQNLDQNPPNVHKLLDDSVDKHVFDLLQNSGNEFISKSSKHQSLLHPLKDGDVLQTKSQNSQPDSIRSLQVVHSPGHTSDHICLLLKEDGILLTGDHVLGQGTSVFEDLGAYLRSLKKCKSILDKQNDAVNDSTQTKGHLYPAHGPSIIDGIGTLQQYLDHRIERENQILDLLAQSSPSTSVEKVQDLPLWTIPEIVSKLYSEYPESLYPAAARGVFLHLQKLAAPDPEVADDDSTKGQKVHCYDHEDKQSRRILDLPKDDQSWLQVMDLRWSLMKSPITKSNNQATL